MSSKIVITLILLSFFTRFFGLNWDNSYYSHPDENNMATSLSQLTSTNLNPHFFAYGQFPLYLGYFSLNLVNIPNTFPNSIYILRFYSAIFSLLFLYFSFLLSKKINISSNIFLTLLIFSPGLIQISHFGTTESFLSFVFITILYLLIKIYEKPKFIFFIYSALLSGLALATKITAIFFIWPVVLMGVYKKEFLSTIFFIFATTLLFLIVSPYNWINFNEFLSSMRYETGVASGIIEVFYTRQFLNTTPYIFQFTKIFPYVLGLPTFIISLFGLIIFIKNYSKKYIIWLLILLPVTCYFIYFGQLFVKWTRFMSPIFFIFPLFATIFISRLKHRHQLLVTGFCIIPGILFFSQYFLPNPRVMASNWINKNMPPNSTILSESGNVVDLKLRPDINLINFDFYTLDSNYENKIELDNLLSTVDYILIPSRRVFKNQNNNLFPYTKDYYQNIFSNKYNLIYQSLGRDESAEETFTVFDFPTIRLYEKK